jgi:hypothetical protein
MTARLNALETRGNVPQVNHVGSSNGSGSSGGRKPKARSEMISGMKPGDIDRLMLENRCFKCKEVGHQKRDCTKPVRLNW